MRWSTFSPVRKKLLDWPVCTGELLTIIVQGILGVCRALNIEVIAEGVETTAEFALLRDMGIGLFQGFLFARPGFEALPAVDWSALD